MNARVPPASCTYGSALLPKNGKLRSASPTPNESWVSTMTAMPSGELVDCHDAAGRTVMV